MEEEIVALGVPRLSPGARIRALEEAIKVVRALSGGGDPVTFDGEFYNVTELTPAAAPTPPIWIGSGGPKGLAVTGRNADGWVPPHAADWRSTLVAESRPIIDEAAASVGRNPADVGTIYIVPGRITRDPLPETRNDDGRWIGGGVTQWVEELTFGRARARSRRFPTHGPSWREHQRHDTEPLGARSRARRPRSNRQGLTSGKRKRARSMLAPSGNGRLRQQGAERPARRQLRAVRLAASRQPRALFRHQRSSRTPATRER